jgi:exopolyphosphatase/guanosine-5'-triphosphate,3'-diphosphate pyrophosphatase
MSVSDLALREGALYDLIGRIEHRDPRETSVEALATRYGVDRDQSNRVRATALQAFDAVSATWKLTGTDRARLDWAARLHEIGLAIAHDRYHRHGAYLVQHSDLNGFSREEQLVLSTLIFTHRRKLAPEMFNVLPERVVRPTMHTSVLLRIAVLLHRSRLPHALPPIHWEAGAEALAVTFPANWLEDHPLTGVDLIAERQGLSNIGIALVFE